MKLTWIFLLFLMLLCISISHVSHAELTKQDILEIQGMFDKHKSEIQLILDKQEKNLKDYIDTKIEAVKDSISALQWAVGVVGILVVAILATPQWINIMRERRESRWQELFNIRLEEMRKDFERRLEEIKRPS